MKLLQINAVYGYGSTGVIVKDIHEMCLESGIDSYVAYSTSSDNDINIKNGYKIGNVLGKKIHALLGRINGQQAYFSSFATRKFLKYIDEISPDIVHLHNLHSNYINLNMLLKYLAEKDIATVLTLHDCWFFTGGCFHYTEAKCFKWKEKCGNCPKKHTDTPAYCLDLSRKIQSDREKYFSQIKKLTTVGVSDWIASEAKQTFLGKSDVRRIYNGVDLDFFKNTPSDMRTELGIDEDKFVVLAMANKWLLPVNADAFKYVTSKLPENAVMLMVGCSEEQKQSLPPNVIGIDFIKEREKLRNVYSLSDVFINCTREDSLPFVNFETQACGLPVITYGNTGAKETVDGYSSFSVNDGDYHTLSDKLLELIENHTISEKICSQFIVEEFDMNKNYQKYIDLYYEIYQKSYTD